MAGRIAILDLGTNTFNLLIAEKRLKSMKIIYQSKEISRLGEGGIHKKEIIPSAFERGIKAILKHRQSIEKFSCHKVFAFATSAIRDAVNGKEFAEEVRRKTGIIVEIIGGEKEAELIWEGARKAIDIPTTSLVMDIGGGSVEFIIGNRSEIFWKKSLPAGVSRLKELFLLSDPATSGEWNAIGDFIAGPLKEISEKCHSYAVQTLIGCSGSFDTYADILSYKTRGIPFDFTRKTSYRFKIPQLPELLSELKATTAASREEMEGLLSMRKDFIVYSAILTEEVMQKCKIKNVFLSTYSLKEGAFFSQVND